MQLLIWYVDKNWAKILLFMSVLVSWTNVSYDAGYFLDRCQGGVDSEE